MMNVDKIISESINRVITEGYAGKEYENLFDSGREGIINWFETGKKHYFVPPLKFDVYVSLDKYNIVKDDGTPLKGAMPAHVRICYRPDYMTENGEVLGKTSFGKEININLEVTKTATFETIKSSFLHEITHVVDILIGLFKGYTSYRHQPNSFLSVFPPSISEVIYRLWDTTEFNAWQTETDLNDFVETIMEDLKEANKINDRQIWLVLGAYLGSANQRKPAKRNLRNPDRIKKYFISTSFNKLKKFIKKYKM